ncbi:MAG: gliding motility-associated C-terminal domain-containing protein [Cytophagales bacterium]|nr:gliding motility-associated C-terminal domain-containing protein [Bernardetiaceae bacterium]MDW8205700.1 gliding motility-associated C-terminal domain-containing protein [Cytophagales bacterium]
MTQKLLGKFFTWCAVVLTCGTANAQNNLQPCFRLPATIVCAPATITPIDCSGAPPNLIVYDYGDGQLRLDKSFTFTRPGKYAIRQGLNTLGAGGNISQPLELTVIAPQSPTFRLSNCNNRTVAVEITDTHFPAYIIEWGDGTSAEAESNSIKQHSYNAEGTFEITVKGITGQNITCGSAVQRVQVVNQLPPPSLRAVHVQSDGRARISYNLPVGFSYRLRQTSPSNNTVKLFDLPPGSSSFTAPDVVSAFDQYIYSIEAINPCHPAQPVTYFNFLGTHNIRVTPMRELNRINWSAPTHIGFTSFALFRNGSKIGEWTTPNVLQFDDREITCGEQYCYRLEARYYNGTALSVTQEVCMTTSRDSNPQRLAEPLATVSNEQVLITWRQPERTRIAQVLLRKIVPGQAAQQITLSRTQPPYTDASVFTAGDSYCYQLSYIDNCGNQAPWTEPFCTTVLRGAIRGDSVLLNWQELRGYNLIGYVIEQLDNNDRVLQTFRPTERNSFFLPTQRFHEQLLRFRVTSIIQTLSGPVALYSNTIRLRIEAVVQYPTAFSPNNDGLNDTFGVKTQFINKFSLQIFNRWGELVYYSENPDERWDGTYKGIPVPAGTYVLVIQAEDLTGRKIEQKNMLLVAK